MGFQARLGGNDFVNLFLDSSYSLVRQFRAENLDTHQDRHLFNPRKLSMNRGRQRAMKNPRFGCFNQCNTTLEYRGATRTLAEWCQILGLRRDTVYKRLQAGWSIADALEKPAVRGRPRKKLP